MAFNCIPKEKIDDFKRALKNKDLDVFELMKMSTEERTAIFREFAGENAKTMNTLFEEKLILKNRVQGIKNWASKVGEVGRYDPAKKAKLDQLISEYKARQQERMFSPKEDEGFLADLVEQKLGVRISKEQAQIAYDMQVKADKLFENVDNSSIDPQKWKWKEGSEKAQAEYGATKRIYQQYIDNLKTGNLPVKDMLKEYSQEIKDLWKDSKYKATQKIMSDAAFGLSKTMINAVASWDNSFLGRQGAITLVKSPKTWWNMAKNSMKDFYQTLKGQRPEDVLMAEIYADIDYINGNYAKAKLQFGIEEEVPTQILERTPVIGRIFKASDITFLDSAIRARRGLFKIQKQVYEAKGIELTDTLLKDMGTHINAITARGRVGMVLGNKLSQLLLWAPKMMKADWDILTAHTFGFGLETKTVRIEAAKTITNVVLATAAITAIAEAMGADVEKDPRSTDFLAIKVGNTRIKTPFMRGMPQIVTLIARGITKETKSSSGVINKINSGEYGSKSLFDVGIDFLVNKTTPPVGAVLAWARGRDYTGEKPTAGKTAIGLLPISVQNFIGLKDEATAMSVFGAFADLFGISANTYSVSDVNWGDSTSKEMNTFREQVGEDKFKKANDLYNKRYEEWFASIKNDTTFSTLSNDDKKRAITTKKGKIKDEVFREYEFKYKQKKLEKLPKF